MRVASFTSLTGHNEKTPRPQAGSRVTEKAAGRFEELPGGARTGLMLHAVLERADFQGLESPETRRLVGQQLRSFGFEETLADAVQGDLRTVAATPLTSEPDAPRLVDLAASRQLRELEFTLGLGGPALSGLADILQRHAAPASIPDYHEQLRGVSSGTLQTFLRGYIDLMFEWQGRWYVADYKSNRLASYDAQTVGEAVSREHYALQAQLYTAAAHRYLSQRVEGYEPGTQWGGALFLFVRGMRGADAPGHGVFFDRQPATLLYEVDRWLGGSDASE
jgi:exodeoxyribonuclease V beta subunit